MTAMVTARRRAGRIQLERTDGHSEVGAGLRADRDRLQGDAAIRTADQHVGAKSGADRRFRAGADISAGESAGAAPRRRKHCPDNIAATGEADIDTEPANGSRVTLAVSGARRGVNAIDLLARAENEPDAGRDSAIERPDPRARLRFGRERQHCGGGSGNAKTGQNRLFHIESPYADGRKAVRS